MALNSSGPISFGGSTVGQSINLELGVSATALASINSTAFRTLAGVASGQISISNFYGKSNVQGWVGTYSYGVPTTTYYQTADGVGFDSSNNIFVYGRFGYPSIPIDAPSLIKINSTGVLQGGITMDSGVTADDPDVSYGQTLAMDSSGNPYVSATVNGRPGLIKFNNAANAITWAYNTNLNNTIFGNARNGGAITDFSGNIWSSALATQSGLYRSGLLKVTTGGSLTFGPYITDSRYIQGPAAVDNAGYVYYYRGIYWTKVQISSYAAVGEITQSSTNRGVMVCDSSNNLYIATQQSGSFCILTKFNSSFVEQWSRKLSGYTNNGGPRNIIIGGDGNIYICGAFASAGQPGWIVKYNSSGVLQWQRQFYNANQDTAQPPGNVISAIAYSSYGLAFAGRVQNNAGSPDPDKTAAIMGIIPLIGNGTGSYNPSGASINITYTTLAGTDSANTFGASSSSPSGPGVNTVWDVRSPTTVSATGTAYKSSLA